MKNRIASIALLSALILAWIAPKIVYPAGIRFHHTPYQSHTIQINSPTLTSTTIPAFTSNLTHPVSATRLSASTPTSTNPASSLRHPVSGIRHPASNIQPPASNYPWPSVDSLLNLGQPRSALVIVNKIYEEARNAKDTPQYLKAILYRTRIQSEFIENFIGLTIRELRAEFSKSEEPATSFIHSLLAEVYWNYYKNNSFRFLDRTRLAQGISDSIETWDLNTISEAITNEYLLSIQNEPILKSIPIGSFRAILDTTGERNYRMPLRRSKKEADPAVICPTLYDFLAQRALDYFTSGQGPQNQPASQFQIDNTAFFGPASGFSKLLSGPSGWYRGFLRYDSISNTLIAVRIFQSLAAFHLNDKNPAALVNTEIERLSFIREKATVPSRDSLYAEALKGLEQTYRPDPASTAVSFALATFYNEQGQKYQPLRSDRYKWDIKTARDICDAAVKRFPDSDGARNCKTLAQRIREKELKMITESAVASDKPSLAKMELKNISELFFRILKVSPQVYSEKQSRTDKKEFLRYLNSLPVRHSWSQTIPNDGDFQVHSATLAVPALQNGFYLLLCSTDKSFKDNNQVLSYSPFWSTRLSYVSKNDPEGGSDWYVLNRETGLPLKNVMAEAWERKYDYSNRDFVTVRLGSYKTDETGYFRYPETSDKRTSTYFMKLFLKDDTLFTENMYQYPVIPTHENTFLQTMFYTDRAIYRPGQNVYFKGIILERTGDRSRIKADQKTRVVFTDANGQKITELYFTTNDFGSFNGSFTIPTGRMTGAMTISNESGSTGFSVEEYRRPTFEVVFDPLEGNYKLGERINATGKAKNFAGNPVDQGTVKFRVTRTVRHPFRGRAWFWPVNPGPEVEIASGTTRTGSQGNFTIGFIAWPDPVVDKGSKPVFDFTITADVTDLNGETQSIRQTVSVGYTSLLVTENLDEKVNILKDSILKITTANLNGKPTPATVSLVISRLRQPDRAFRSLLWERTDLNLMTEEEFRAKFPYDPYGNESDPSTWPTEKIIVTTTVNTASDSILVFSRGGSGDGGSLNDKNRLPELDPGVYSLVMKAADPWGEIVEVKEFFTAFRPDSREVPSQTINWFIPLKTSGEPGENAQFLIGSKEDNLHVMYEIRFKDSLVSREWIRISNRMVRVDVPIKESYRGNFSVNFVFAKHNRIYQNSQLITVPYTNKKLDIAFETFRNTLDPGAREEWKIRISDAKKEPVRAEFLTAMYDASLDVFRSNTWGFNIYQRYYGLQPWDADDFVKVGQSRVFGPDRPRDGYIISPAFELNWFGLYYFGRGGRDRMYRSAKAGEVPMMMDMKATASQEAGTAPPDTGVAEKQPPPVTQTTEETPANIETSPGTAAANPRVRKDFRETAFFYPALMTDSAGNLVVSFTVPESLTRWKLSGLAYTTSLDYGLIEKEVVTRKDLMVFPNAPRFVRQGDTVVLSTKVVNLSDRDLSCDLILKLFNALDQKAADLILLPETGSVNKPGAGRSLVSNSTARVDIPKGQSAQGSWILVIPSSTDLSLLQYRITAQSGNFSDGEERAIPVMTNRMMVTESMPLPVRGKSTSGFTFGKLLQSGKDPDGSLRNYRLTLEFATNPAWYAVQALPALNDKKYNNADAVFNAFYSNSMASFIANSNPRIRHVFESWKTITPDALLSNLEKNEDLKSALIQETPWVMEAKDESQQKRQLGLYFDLSNLEANLKENLARLQKLQTHSGAWTWFEGMPENRWITQNIITGLGRLDHLGAIVLAKDPALMQVIRKGISYLDGELSKDLENLKNIDKVNLDDNHLSPTQIQYLYARSYFLKDKGLELNTADKPFMAAYTYYHDQAVKYWLKQDRYLQGMLALALQRLGDKEVAAQIVRSLKERSLHSDELGTYWAGPQDMDWYRWYQAPVETQAMMIEVFDEIAQDEAMVEELKIWLLKQKETQLWRSDRATVEACYALLLRGTDLLALSGDVPAEGSGSEMDVTITLGKLKINPAKLTDVRKEAGTGYFRMSWQGEEIRPDMGKVTISKKSGGIAWGAIYWQYFEDLDQITPAVTPLKLEKKVFIERITPAGPVLEEITSSSTLHPEASSLRVGDKLVVRMVVTADRDLEFVHLKDMRASSFEPIYLAGSGGKGPSSGAAESLSGYRFQDGLGYYQSTTDLATNFFFDFLPKGTHVLEYGLRVNVAGDYSNGITTIQSMYAPGFSAHSEGIRVRIP